MSRLAALLLVSCVCGLAQSSSTEEAFLRAVRGLASRTVNGQPVEAGVRIQEDLGLSPADAEAVVESAREYFSELPKFGIALGRSILDRRLRSIADEKIDLPSEAELVAENDRKIVAFRAGIMAGLRERVGDATYEHLLRYMSMRQGAFFPLRNGDALPAPVARN